MQLVRKGFPVDPPEPVDISADTREIEDPGPEPAVMVQILEMADQAKKEPSFDLPLYVLNMLNNKERMSKMALNYDPGDLLVRFGLRHPPIAT